MYICMYVYKNIYRYIYIERERGNTMQDYFLGLTTVFLRYHFFFVLIIIYRLSNKFSITHSRDEAQ